MFLLILCFPDFSYGVQDDEGEKNINDIKHTTFTIGGTYRLRGEVQDKFNVKTYGTGTQEDYLISRLRLHLDLQVTQKLSFFLEIQDAEVLGLSFEDKDFKGKNNPYHDPFDINKAYISFKPSEEIEMKIGRQSISFADRRVFGPGDWGNTGRYAWDAIVLRINNDYVDSNWLTGRYIIHDPDRWPNEHIDTPTAFATYSTIKKLPFLLDIFYVFKSDDSGTTQGEKGTGDLSSHSIGFHIDGKKDSWDYSSTVAGQIGEWGADDIRAYGFAFHLGYTFDTPWKPHLIAQYVVGSGDKDPNDGKHGTFDGIFGGVDTVLYGWMNLFCWQNLREYRIDFILNPQETFTIRAEYHYFTLDEAKDAWYYPGKAPRRDETGASGRELGHEVDLTVRKKVAKFLEMLVGYSFFVPGEFIKNTGKHPTSQWYFLETTFYF